MASQLDFRVKNGLVVQSTATFVSSVQAVSTASGAVQIIGGAGIGGNLWVGGTVNVAGTINASVTGVITSATNIANGTAGQIPYQSAPGVTTFFGAGTAGQVLVSRGASASGPTFQNTLTLAGSTAATSTTTGALVVTGGVGIGQNLFVNDNTTLGTNYNNTATGSKITLRGILQTATVSSIIDTTLNVALALPLNNWSIVSTDGNYVRNVLSKDSSNNVTVGVSGSSFHNDVNIYTGPSGAFNIYSGTGQIRSHFDNQGVLRISTTTVATSTITGALQVAGGVGVGGSAYFGNDLYLTKPTNNYVYLINSNTVGNYNNEIYFKTTNAYSNIGNQSGVGTIAVLDNSDSSKGSIRFFKNGSFTDLGIFASGFGSTSTANLLVRLDQSQFTTDLIVKSSTNAVSTTTGAFQVTGGVGVGGNIVIGGNSTVTNNEVILGTTAVSSTITGALQVRGGVGVGGSMFVGGVVTATNFFSGPWAVSTGTSLAVQWVGSALGTVDTLNFATGTTATVVGRTVTIQSVGQVTTVAQPVAANYFPVFVDSNNATTTGETLFTTSSFSVNPGTGSVTITGTAAAGSNAGALQVTGGIYSGDSLYSVNGIKAGSTGNLLTQHRLLIAGAGGSGWNLTSVGRGIDSESFASLNNILDTGTVTNGMMNRFRQSTINASAAPVTYTNLSTIFIDGAPVVGSPGTNITVRNAWGIYSGGAVGIFNTASSTSTTTGALVVAGGVGIGGNFYTAGVQRITNNTAATSTQTGALVVEGGVGIGGALYAGNIFSNGSRLIPTNIQEITATGGQTTFTITGGYTVGSVQVFANGVNLGSGDFTASNGTTVVVVAPRNSGDVMRFVSGQTSSSINNINALALAYSVALGS